MKRYGFDVDEKVFIKVRHRALKDDVHVSQVLRNLLARYADGNIGLEPNFIERALLKVKKLIKLP